MIINDIIHINWSCQHTWLQSSKNTLWCLLGCCIGDFGTIGFFQFMEIAWPVSLIMTLAIINGIITSIILETIILSKQMLFKLAFKTAIITAIEESENRILDKIKKQIKIESI